VVAVAQSMTSPSRSRSALACRVEYCPGSTGELAGDATVSRDVAVSSRDHRHAVVLGQSGGRRCPPQIVGDAGMLFEVEGVADQVSALESFHTLTGNDGLKERHPADLRITRTVGTVTDGVA
jgi:hypothetical protein